MTTLVTGAAGFIGTHLCAELLARGGSVVGLDAFTDFYDPEEKRANVAWLAAAPGFAVVEADLGDADLDAVLDGVDTVVHLAGEPGVSTSWGASFERYLHRNVLATQRLLEAACRSDVRRFVFGSSSSVYGSGSQGLRARLEPRPISPYGVTKLAAEALVGAYARACDLETVKATTAELPLGAVLDVASGHPIDVATVVDELRRKVDPEELRLEHRAERRGDVPRTAGRIAMAREHLGWEPTTDLRTGLGLQLEWHRQRPARALPLNQAS